MNIRGKELDDPIVTGLEGEIAACTTVEEIERLKPIVYQIRNENMVKLWREKYWSLAPRLEDRKWQ